MEEIVALEGSGEAVGLVKPQEVKLELSVAIQPEGTDSETKSPVQSLESVDVKPADSTAGEPVVDSIDASPANSVDGSQPSGYADGEAAVDSPPPPTEKKDAEPENDRPKDGSIANSEEDVAVTEEVLTEEVLTADDTTTETTPEKLDRDGRFERAEEFFGRKKYDLALKNYLACITGIDKDSLFVSLPVCIRRIAEIYHLQGEDEKAVHFLRAEKMYYETALIDTKSIQDQMELMASKLKEDDSGVDIDLLRAAEYENLGLLCHERKQSALALEFVGKATKLYQQKLGDSHETTEKCLTLFTQLYAEVGKEEYRENLESFNQSDKPLDVHKTVKKIEQLVDDIDMLSDLYEPTQCSGDPDEAVDEGLESKVEEKEPLYWTDVIPTKILLTVMVLCLIASVILLGFSYCRVMASSPGCRLVRKQLKSYWGLVEYGWYKLEALMYGKPADQ